MKNVYGYIRVSDKKQEDGASLIEQKRIIKEYAKTNNLNIIQFYEETKTAAKKGRPIFTKMLNNLKQEKAEGLIMHKIDRSARNLHDWAAIGDLIDNNIAVFFAHESLNLNERGGRLSADIQAVMASDYVRNLRQETVKGLYGRIKQGIYPFAAPVGYIDNGKGELKTICSEQGKLVKELFKLYITEEYNVMTLADEMERRGLLNQRGNRVCKNGITRILKNPFYVGMMEVKGESFEGKHKPLISTRTFKQAQLVLKGRQLSKGLKHNYIFRKLIRCENCNYHMPGEKQKGMVYYRCQTKECSTKTIREDHVEHYVKNVLQTISLDKKELHFLNEIFVLQKGNQLDIKKAKSSAYNVKLKALKNREQKLLEAYLDNLVNRDDYESSKRSIIIQTKEIEEKIDTLETSKESVFTEINNFLELCNNPVKLYDSAVLEEKREYLKNVTSNLTVSGKSVSFIPLSPYREIANRDILLSSAHFTDTDRTLTSKITYTDKNTSGVTPKPLSKKQIGQFFNILLNKNLLSASSKPTTNHEIPKDNPCAE